MRGVVFEHVHHIIEGNERVIDSNDISVTKFMDEIDPNDISVTKFLSDTSVSNFPSDGRNSNNPSTEPRNWRSFRQDGLDSLSEEDHMQNKF